MHLVPGGIDGVGTERLDGGHDAALRGPRHSAGRISDLLNLPGRYRRSCDSPRGRTSKRGGSSSHAALRSRAGLGARACGVDDAHRQRFHVIAVALGGLTIRVGQDLSSPLDGPSP
jgi:hypothetical protein